MKKESVLILCTGNSCRSQMAEGALRFYGSERFDVESAGTKPGSVNETATEVMHEVGIDISKHRSKHLDEFKGRTFDYVITVCDNAREACPYFPGKKVLHWPFPDPPHAKAVDESVREEFRKVRDMILKKFKSVAEKGFDFE